MPNISQWELDRLNEHEKEMWQLQKQNANLVEALVPLILTVLEEQHVIERINEIIQEYAYIHGMG